MALQSRVDGISMALLMGNPREIYESETSLFNLWLGKYLASIRDQNTYQLDSRHMKR